MKSLVTRGVWRTIGGLSLILWLAGAASLEAQVVKVLDYTNTFRYNATDNLNTVDWTSRTYNDATGNWAGGPGLLAYETSFLTEPIRTVLGNPSMYNPAGHAVYFRAHFGFNSTNPASLILTNRIDDGAVFYLNGLEIRRINVTANPVMFTSLSMTTAVENTETNFTCIATNLVVGDNVLSAIVLQSSTTSADTVYGTILWAENLNPISITSQPADAATELNGSTAFSVAVSGTKPTYQWQYGVGTNGPWSTASGTTTNASYSIASAQLIHDGFYRAIVSNPANSVTSRVARLEVTVDTVAPEVVGVAASETDAYIVLTFNERLLASTATNPANYLLSDLSGTMNFVILEALLSDNLVRLRYEPFGLLSNHVVTVSNLADISTNWIAPGTRIGIPWPRDILPLDHAWNWSDAGVDLGSDWSAPGYNESTNSLWAQANPVFFPVTKALFYATYGSLPGPKNTAITIGWRTYYFRTRFILPPGTQPFGSLRFSHVIDDGAVFYLNGREVYRYNMPVGTVSFSSVAATAVSNPTLITTTNLAVTNLVGGTNVLAVETHVSSFDSFPNATVVFGTALRAACAPDPDVVAPPRLAVRREANSAVVISWDGSGFVLQYAPTPLGAWTSLPQASSPHTNAVAEAQQYFRLKQ